MKIRKRSGSIETAGNNIDYNDGPLEARSKNRQVLDRMYNDLASRAGVLGKLDSKLFQEADGTYVRRMVDRSPAEYQEGGEMMSEGPSRGMDQEGLMRVKQMHEQALQANDMEKAGQIEMMVKEVYENSDEETRGMIDELFPELGFMAEGEEEEQPQPMMKRGGVLYKF